MTPALPLEAWRETAAKPVDVGDLHFVTQAAWLFEEAGVHLLERRARGIDPVERLERLRAEAPGDRASVYRALLAIFAAYGDRHSRCILPPSWSERFAYLPFVVAACGEGNASALLVMGSATDSLQRGDRVIAWNGMPIGEVLQAHADWQLGANAAARRAKAVQTLTVRPLGLLPPPAGRIEVITEGPSGRKGACFSWRVGDAMRVANDLAPCLAPDAEWVAAAHGISNRTVGSPAGPIGWLRIASLRVPAAQFLPALSVVLEQQPPRLVLDLRGCEEGFIQTGEQMLGLFGDRPVEPLRFELRPTALLRDIVRNCAAMTPWQAPIDAAIAAGRAYTAGMPLTPPITTAPAVYRGRVLLLVDALTYSSAEMFVAGMQDHGLASVLGVAPRTGGGGATAWTQDVMQRLSGDASLVPAPGAPSARMAVMRCRRTGASAMRLIEGEGVIPDAVHLITRRDLVCDEADLIAHTAHLLAQQ